MSASIRAKGIPASPNPPTSTVAPAWMPATASSAVSNSWVRAMSRRLVLQHHGESLPYADADGCHPPAHVAFAKDLGQSADDPAAGGTQRVAERDRTAPGVDHSGIDPPGVDTGQRLHRKRL